MPRRKRMALPSVGRKRKHKYKQGAKSSVKRKAKYCSICHGAHKPRHGLPSAKALLKKGMSPRRAKVILRRRNKGKSRGLIVGKSARKRALKSAVRRSKAPRRTKSGRFAKKRWKNTNVWFYKSALDV